MQSAIEDEEYEIAAKLRDRISKLEPKRSTHFFKC